jgi:hypothetical protein
MFLGSWRSTGWYEARLLVVLSFSLWIVFVSDTLWWKSNGLGFCYSFVVVCFLIFGESLVEFKRLVCIQSFLLFQILFVLYVDLQRLRAQQIYIGFCIHWKFHCIVARSRVRIFKGFWESLIFSRGWTLWVRISGWHRIRYKIFRVYTEVGRTQRRSTKTKFWCTDSQKIRARNSEPWYWQRLFAISSWSRQDPLPGSNIESTRGLHHLKGIA